MIKHFHIDNFKSLVDFRLSPEGGSLAKFTCLVGLNGAGKSTVLQALDFIGHLASGEIDEWLKAREWKPRDMISQFARRKQLISFEVGLDLGFDEVVVWKAAYNTSQDRCTSEEVLLGAERQLRLEAGELVYQPREPSFTGKGQLERLSIGKLKQSGSSLSLLKDDSVGPVLSQLKAFTETLKSLDMLSPQSMRKRAREGTDIGYGGERLSAFIHSMSAPRRQRLLSHLQTFYPRLESLEARAVKAGWKDLRFTEGYLDADGKPMVSSARHINDGLLRVLAVLAEVQPASEPKIDGHSNRGCVLFDEIENGINPELVRGLVDFLRTASPQVIVTTHSPMILNYLPDDEARRAVLLIYRNTLGHTQAVRFFDLPSANERLGLLGPGEVFVDVDLRELSAQAAEQAPVA
jgi:predicted ATPase